MNIDLGDPELADEAMRLAIMVYGTLLEHSERSVGRGLHQLIYDLSRPVCYRPTTALADDLAS